MAFNVGYRVEIDKWSKDTQRYKINTTHSKKKVSASIINRKIQEYEQACENIFTKFNAENKIPTADEFRVEFNKEIGKEKKLEKGIGFFEIYALFMSEEDKKKSMDKKYIWCSSYFYNSRYYKVLFIFYNYFFIIFLHN